MLCFVKGGLISEGFFYLDSSIQKINPLATFPLGGKWSSKLFGTFLDPGVKMKNFLGFANLAYEL